MIKINVVAVGKVKERYFADGIEEYKKRISRFADFKIIEVAEENRKATCDGVIESVKEKEEQNVLPHLKGYVIATAIEGKKISSEKLAEILERLPTAGNGEITFVIGGSYGLSDSVKKRADLLISFSDMTFPHTLFRLLLTEQIYRACCINSGVSYHK